MNFVDFINKIQDATPYGWLIEIRNVEENVSGDLESVVLEFAPDKTNHSD